MKAWIITWEYCGEHAKVNDQLIAIFGSRTSGMKIAEFVQNYHKFTMLHVDDIILCMNNSKLLPDHCKVKQSMIINKIPHGERITCGGNPNIYGRKVSEFKVSTNEKGDMETLSWREPPIYKWANENQSGVTLDREGSIHSMTRELKPLIPSN